MLTPYKAYQQGKVKVNVSVPIGFNRTKVKSAIVDKPKIVDLSDSTEIYTATQAFLKKCSKELNLSTNAKHMFFLNYDGTFK